MTCSRYSKQYQLYYPTQESNDFTEDDDVAVFWRCVARNFFSKGSFSAFHATKLDCLQ